MGGFMPTNLERLAQAGIDVFRDPQDWAPAVQTLRGGARTDLDGATDVPGLFAAGMAQAFDPGLFNGWSSMRAMWSGQRAGRAAAALLEHGGGAPATGGASRRATRAEAKELCRQAVAPLRTGGDGIRNAPWSADGVLGALHETLFARDVCLAKEAGAMALSLDTIRMLSTDATRHLHAADPHELVKVHETHNMLAVAQLFLTASLARTESRGDHQRADHPTADNDRWLRWLNLSSTDTGRPHLGAVARPPALVLDVAEEPVPLDGYPNRPDARR
jgi:succinate dehydrogenase/fumarate reductase flavoprotein subunit